MKDITEIQYPCYIHKKVEGTRLIYVHDTLYYKETGEPILGPIMDACIDILTLRNYMLEGIYNDGKLYLYDGMTVDEYKNRTCNLIYQDRLGLVRHCVNCIGKHKIIIDMALDKCDDIGELIINKDKLKVQGHSSIIKEIHGKYKF